MQSVILPTYSGGALKKTILLVEDEVITSMAQAQFLNNSGYNVITALNGESAVELASGNILIDLILMDIDLGQGIDGTEAACMILAEKNIPILFLTSHSEEDMVRKVRNVTRYGYVVKNSGEFVLLSSIEMAFELFDAHNKTREREELLDVTLQSIAECVISTDSDGKIVKMNRAAEQLTGWTFAEAAGCSLYDVFHVTDAENSPYVNLRFMNFDPLLKSSERRRNLILISRNGDVHRISKSSSPIMDDSGCIMGRVLVFRDITGEYEAQKIMMERSALMRGLFENIPSGVIIFRIQNDGSKSSDYCVTDINSSAMKITRQGKDELIGKTLNEIIPEIEEYDVLAFYRSVWETGKTEHFPSKVFKNGKIAAWFNNYAFKLPTGEIVAIFNNISEQKRAEEALRKSEARYRLLADNTGDSIWTMDLELRFTYVSPSAFTLKGHSPDEVLTYTVKDIMSPESYSLAFQVLQDEIENDRNGADPKRTRRLLFEHNVEGEPRWLESTLSFIRDIDGKPAGVLGATRDVTERKFAEDALRDSEKMYRLLADNTADNIWTMDIDLKFTYSSPSVYKLRGYTPEEALMQRVEDTVTPGSIELVYSILKEELEKDKNGAPSDRERRVVLEHYHKEGHKLWLESSLSFMRDEDGNINGILGVTRDITDRKRVEDALRESEERYRLIADHTADIIWTADLDLNFTYSSPSVLKIRGYTQEEIFSQTVEDTVVPESREIIRAIFREEYQKALTSSMYDNIKPIVFEHCHKNGSRIWLESSISFMRDSNGVITGLLGISRDINDRKLAEDALRNSEEKLHLIMDGIPAYLAYLDSSERYVYVNKAYSDWHSKTREDFVGKHVSEAVPADYILRAEPYCRRVLAGEQVVYENSFTGKDGVERAARVEYVPHISGDSVIGFFALTLDITEQKKSTEKVVSLLKEKELLLKEVHHRIKNNMGSIASLLYLQSDTLDDPSAIGAIQDARSRVLSMMGIYEMLYRSDDYRSVSVSGYMNDLIEKISSTYIGNSRVVIQKEVDEFKLDSSLLFPAGMIVNELLTNALKYAFPAGKTGNICVRVHKNGGKAVELSVRDNGVGLPDSGIMSKSRGFGLSLVNMLVQQINGRLSINRNGGTEFRITFLS